MALLIRFGESSLLEGGEFERKCAAALRDELSDDFVVITNISLSRGAGAFYECDAIVSGPDACYLLEMKSVVRSIDVYEDLIQTCTGWPIDRVFSLLDAKAKVLGSRRRKPPFAPGDARVWVSSSVVVPDGVGINVRHDGYKTECPVRTLTGTLRWCAAGQAKVNDPARRIRNRRAWEALREQTAPSELRNSHRLGRFTILRPLGRTVTGDASDYVAIDEPPVSAEVLLREYPFDSTLPGAELGAQIERFAKEMKILRTIRHPNVACVIGHFQTGCSWVQVCDWFQGKRLEDVWPAIAELPLLQRLELFRQVLAALHYCHGRGVFHRDVCAANTWVSDDLQEVRLAGFECGLDVEATGTLTTTRLDRRDRRLIPPEELQNGVLSNPRLADAFQAGVLLFRLVTGGNWPFSDPLVYASTGVTDSPSQELGADATRALALAKNLMAPTPSKRPDPLSKVEAELRGLFLA